MAEQLEIEQKFEVDADFERPDFAVVAGRLGRARDVAITAAAPVLHRLSATYFDTPDGRLAASKITLRRRTGGPDAGWHLKLPADVAVTGGARARREVHAPLDSGGGEHAVPASLTSRVAGVTDGLPLAPIAILDTERTVVALTSPGGSMVAEIADDVVTARRLASPRGAAGPTLRWREIEVEVAAADPELQQAAADLLFAAGARPAGHGSKLARVLGS